MIFNMFCHFPIFTCVQTLKNAQDEDLVDDTLDDVPIGTDVEIASADVPPPPIDFDDNDGYDDGYDSPGDSSVADVESSALF